MAKRSKKDSPKPNDGDNLKGVEPLAGDSLSGDSASQSQTGDDDADWGEISLEELGQAYAEAMAEVIGPDHAGGEADAGETVASDASGDDSTDESDDDSAGSSQADVEEDDSIPTPTAIIEAALFIGNPENRGISEAALAALMRDVTVDDVSQYVDRLNESYAANDQAFRIHRDEDGLRLGVAPDMEVVRRAFYGKIRETRLSQHAIEVLSLVAYQPGITAEKVQDQRGKESASLLSQLVRRRLLEQRRVAVEGTKKTTATYHPTERFLQLFGLQSLDDLPQVEA